jgi:hypothetical protein
MSEVVETLMTAGAEIVRASIPTAGWIGGPGTVMAVLNRNPESTTKHDPAHCSIVFVYEIKRDLTPVRFAELGSSKHRVWIRDFDSSFLGRI